jgi:ribosome modulation factor
MAAAAPSAAQSAAAATRDAASAASVAGRLRSLLPAATAAARPAVTSWLAGWTEYVTDQRQLAGALRSPTPATGPDTDELAQRVFSDVVQADSFADANGLDDCRLGSVGSAGGSIVSIP